jgi:hypothetical protein
MKEKLLKFADSSLEVFKKAVDCTEDAIKYVADKLKKVITVKDIFFLGVGFTLALFLCWRGFIYYTNDVVLTGTMAIGSGKEKVVYLVSPNIKPGNPIPAEVLPEKVKTPEKVKGGK